MKTAKSSISSETEEIAVKVNTEVLMNHLEETLKVIETTVSRYHVKEAEDREQQKPKLEEHPEILEFLQNFMGDALDEDVQLPSEVELRTKEIPAILRHYGIQVEVYQPSKPETSSMFDLEPALTPDVQDYVTLKPAFIKDGEALLRGRVIEPAASNKS